MRTDNKTSRSNADYPELSNPSSSQLAFNSPRNNINNRSEQIKLKRGLIPTNYKQYNPAEKSEINNKNIKKNSISQPQNIIYEKPIIPLITYSEAWNIFKKNYSLLQPYTIPNNYSNKYMCMNRICSCLVGQLSNELRQERNLCINLSRLKYNVNDDLHFKILFKIYYFFKKKNCTKIGEHWQDIGFQSDNPEIDLITIGMFGPLQILYCIDKYPNFSLELFSFLVQRKCDWLYAVTMVSLSKFIIQMTDQGVLNFYFNEKQNVPFVLNEIFVGMVAHFKKNVEDYSKNNCLTAEFIAKTIQYIKKISYKIVYFLGNHPYIH